MAAVALHPVAAEAPVEVICRICAQTIPTIGTDSATLLLCLVDLLLQLRGTGVNELELRELAVEDTDDLCELFHVSMQA